MVFRAVCVNQELLLKVILDSKFVLFNEYLFKCSNIVLLIEHQHRFNVGFAIFPQELSYYSISIRDKNSAISLIFGTKKLEFVPI